MDENTKIVQEFYNASVEVEWNRIADRPEFHLTCRMLKRYIKPGDRILDIGGGPGRYSLYLLEKGCDVTLLDLSDANVAFATERAREKGLSIKAICGDACIADTLVSDRFDHVLLMGPLYHLPEETDRIKAVNAAFNLLKPGGMIFISFISAHAGMIYLMKNEPEMLASTPRETEFMNLVIEDKPFSGIGFTVNYFARQKDILPFMEQFPLEKLHLFGQESLLAPCEHNITSQPKEVYERWIHLAQAVCEREEFLGWSEHLMYVGRKVKITDNAWSDPQTRARIEAEVERRMALEHNPDPNGKLWYSTEEVKQKLGI